MKHKKHDQMIENLKETQKRFNKIKAKAEAKLFIEKKSISMKESLTVFDKPHILKKLDESICTQD